MIYTTKQGDSLLSVAGAVTLSPSYADALQRINAGVEEIAQVSIAYPLPAGVRFEIPDNWIKPGAVPATGAGGGFAVPGLPFPIGLNWQTGAILALVYLAFTGTRRR